MDSRCGFCMYLVQLDRYGKSPSRLKRGLWPWRLDVDVHTVRRAMGVRRCRAGPCRDEVQNPDWPPRPDRRLNEQVSVPEDPRLVQAALLRGASKAGGRLCHLPESPPVWLEVPLPYARSHRDPLEHEPEAEVEVADPQSKKIWPSSLAPPFQPLLLQRLTMLPHRQRPVAPSAVAPTWVELMSQCCWTQPITWTWQLSRGTAQM